MLDARGRPAATTTTASVTEPDGSLYTPDLEGVATGPGGVYGLSEFYPGRWTLTVDSGGKYRTFATRLLLVPTGDTRQLTVRPPPALEHANPRWLSAGFARGVVTVSGRVRQRSPLQIEIWLQPRPPHKIFNLVRLLAFEERDGQISAHIRVPRGDLPIGYDTILVIGVHGHSQTGASFMITLPIRR